MSLKENKMKKPKLEDVAKLAGVSRTTVSRVLNNRGYISDETRKKVHHAVETLNYHPNEIARSLFINKTNIIGLIFPSTNNPFYAEMIQNLESSFESLGYKVLLCNSGGRIDKERAYLDMLQRHQVDGIISGAHNRGIEIYEKTRLPIVSIDRYLAPHVPVVSSDNYAGGVLATSHLIEKGCKHIIHINGPIDLETPANLRRKAYEDTMRRHELPYRTYEISNTVVQDLFDENPDVEGIFGSDDIIATQILREAKRRGYKVPEELKVVGYDGADITRILKPELTTIQQPIEAMAKLAVRLLIDQIDGKKDQITLDNNLSVKIIESETT